MVGRCRGCGVPAQRRSGAALQDARALPVHGQIGLEKAVSPARGNLRIGFPAFAAPLGPVGPPH